MPNLLHKLRAWPRSPLSRHPDLFLEKVRGRVFGNRPVEFSSQAPDYDRQALRPIRDFIRDWTSRHSLVDAPIPENRVFGRTFDLEDLFSWCRNGPETSPDLRGDIKLPWEFSRAYALPTHALTLPPDQAVERAAAFITQWQAANPEPNGPAWICAMEVAIRVVNWQVTDALLEGRLEAKLGQTAWRSSIWNHGNIIRKRLETQLVSSNHYLSNLLGLAFVGACFPSDPAARSWLALARREMPRAIQQQVRGDGGLDEASLPYHALVLEMVLWFYALDESPPPIGRVHLMAQCAADFESTTGDVYTIGDDDSGRILALDLACRQPGRSPMLQALSEQVLGASFSAARHALYPKSGWWIARNKSLNLVMSFGGVGLAGQGGHAHNDGLSVCIDVGGSPLVVDPGSYIYCPDPEARNRFRSARAHNAYLVNNREPRPEPDAIFSRPGSDQALTVRNHGADHITVEHGERTRSAFLETNGLRIEDVIPATEPVSIKWFFHLHPGVEAQLKDQTVHLNLPNGTEVRLSVEGAQPALSLATYDFAPGYGQREPAPVLSAKLDAEGMVRIAWVFSTGTPEHHG